MEIIIKEIDYNKHRDPEKYLNYDFIEEDLYKNNMLPKDYIKEEIPEISFVDHDYRKSFDKTILINCKNGDQYLIRGILPSLQVDGRIYLDYERIPKYYSVKLLKEDIIKMRSSKSPYRFLKNFIEECNNL